MEKIKIPYGEADYKTLIEENYIYIDKTMYIEKLEQKDNLKKFVVIFKGFENYFVEEL